MKGNLLTSGFIAVSIHALVLGLPLYRASTTPSNINTPISLSIMSPRMPAAVLQVPADIPSEPVSPVKRKPPVEETSPARKESLPERQSIATPVAEPDFSEEKVAKDVAKPLIGGVTVGAGPVRKDTPADSQKGLAALGNQQGGDVIVYATPKYKQNPLPHYPTVARRRGYEGQTLLRVQVLRSGRVGQIEISTSSGFEILDKAALESVKGWIFVPGTQGGRTVDQWVMVPVRFSLR